MNSALYFGWVRHRRHAPVRHEFRYRTFMVSLDLAELDAVFRGRWLWSARGPALAWFRREDHFGDPARPLDLCIRDEVERALGFRPAGAVRLLTNLRYWGYVMNPVSFFYCHGTDGALQAVVAEVSNTPWDERHLYVLDGRRAEAGAAPRSFEFDKEFHVSPFMPMESRYTWRFTEPGEALAVHMVTHVEGRAVFDATLSLERRAIGTASLAGALARHPFMTGKVIAAIYWQALKLWLKRTPHHPHPGGVRRSAA